MDASITQTLLAALESAQTKTDIHHPHDEDELFDFVLTFFEELAPYKPALKEAINIYTLKNCNLKLIPTLNELVTKIFYAHISTPLDKLTYSLLFVKIFYTWVMDTSPDLSKTCDEINYIAKTIYSFSD